MIILVAGLFIFLGLHSSRIFAENQRQQFITRKGENAWKGLYSIGSLLGFALICWGYSVARQTPIVIWNPPLAMRHIAALLTLISFILISSVYVKNSFFKVKLLHPMTLGVKVWAISHLLANGTLADLVLFGSFLVWAVLCFSAARKRDRMQHSASTQLTVSATASGTLISIAIGVIAWAAMAFWLHAALIGVKPFN